MDRREATPEDLPPLELRKLRDLVCDQDSEDEPSPLLSATMPAKEGLE